MIIDTKEWLKRAEEVSIEEIPNFINELFNSVDWGNEYNAYIDIMNIIYIGMLATFYAINNTKQIGIPVSLQAQILGWQLYEFFEWLQKEIVEDKKNQKLKYEYILSLKKIIDGEIPFERNKSIKIDEGEKDGKNG